MRQALLVLLVAACAAAPVAAGATSPAAYRQQVRQACTAANGTATAMSAAIRGNPTRAHVAASVGRVAAAGSTLVARLRRIRPPAALAPLHRQGIALFTQEVAVLREIVRRLRAGGALRVVLTGPLVDRGIRVQARIAHVYVRLGVPICAK